MINQNDDDQFIRPPSPDLWSENKPGHRQAIVRRGCRGAQGRLRVALITILLS